MNDVLRFLLLGRSRIHNVEFTATRLVIAGWTGRDPAAIEHHIEELGALGVKRPSQVPLFYRVSASNLSQTSTIQVLGGQTSGEVEPVLVSIDGRLWLTLGSDHTDRHSEAYSVALSKQACDKVIADQAWSVDELHDHLDAIELRSWIEEREHGERVLYQQGTLAMIRPLHELVLQFGAATTNDQNPRNATPEGSVPGPVGAILAQGTVMFCGTVPAIGGVRPAYRFHMELHDPVRQRRIIHRYRIEPLEVIE
jgi:hypothetical protein